MDFKLMQTSYLVKDTIFHVLNEEYFGTVVQRIGCSNSVEEAKEKCKKFCEFYKITKID